MEIHKEDLLNIWVLTITLSSTQVCSPPDGILMEANLLTGLNIVYLNVQLKISQVQMSVCVCVCYSSSLTCFDVVVSVGPIEDGQLHQLHLFQIVFSLCLQIQKHHKKHKWESILSDAANRLH